MNELAKIESENIKIEDMIYEVRGKQVILDSDLARLYNCKNGTKDINKAVSRNIERFPEDFYFQLNKEEYQNLKFQFGTSSLNNHGGVRKLPYVFTEQGVAMLATILNSKQEIQVSIVIMNAFVDISKDLINQSYYNQMTITHASEIKMLQDSFNKLQNNKNLSGLFFKGQFYDSYSLLLDIFETAKKSITIIDNHIDKSLLNILKRTGKEILFVINKNNIKDLDKYQKQYNNVKIKICNEVYDRFIIIDNKELYHLGAAFKDFGKKGFAIIKLENEEWLKEILKRI